MGPRLLAGTLLGLTLVLMVVAGMYSRADNASAQGAVRAVDSNELAKSNLNADLTGAAQKKAKPPLPPQEPQPPQPAQEVQPAQPSNPAQPSPPTKPAEASQPTQPAQASQPDQPPPPPPPSSKTAPSAPPPPPARTVDAEDKSSGKAAQEESRQGREQDEVVKGELIEAPQPIYPEEAKEQKIEGIVTVSIVIDEEGKVISAKVASGHQLLHGASKDAAFKARFKPTTVNGKPAKVSGAMTYNFVLDKK
jgi:protein TonB